MSVLLRSESFFKQPSVTSKFHWLKQDRWNRLLKTVYRKLRLQGQAERRLKDIPDSPKESDMGSCHFYWTLHFLQSLIHRVSIYSQRVRSANVLKKAKSKTLFRIPYTNDFCDKFPLNAMYWYFDLLENKKPWLKQVRPTGGQRGSQV